MSDYFPVLIMNARPAAGKSEILQFLQQTPDLDRLAFFHVGKMKVLDDFPLLWSWFEEDDLLERVFHRPRLHTDQNGYFRHHDLWHLLIRRLNLEYHKWIRDHGHKHTIVIEFSRGTEHGGYHEAYQHLDRTILAQAACLYINVSYEESRRKNKRRYNPDRPDSILEHGLSEEKLDRLYRSDDWFELTSADPTHFEVKGSMVPYVIFENNDDVTTQGGPALQSRLQEDLDQLWSLWRTARAV